MITSREMRDPQTRVCMPHQQPLDVTTTSREMHNLQTRVCMLHQRPLVVMSNQQTNALTNLYASPAMFLHICDAQRRCALLQAQACSRIIHHTSRFGL